SRVVVVTRRGPADREAVPRRAGDGQIGDRRGGGRIAGGGHDRDVREAGPIRHFVSSSDNEVVRGQGNEPADSHRVRRAGDAGDRKAGGLSRRVPPSERVRARDRAAAIAKRIARRASGSPVVAGRGPTKHSG